MRMSASLIATVGLLGVMAGAVVVGTLSDVIGRRQTIIWSVISFSVLTLACAFAPNPLIFAALRFLAGLGLGGILPVSLALINEQLWLGHFEMWSGSGLIVFRHAALVGNGENLAFEQAEGIAEAALEECERFYPVFQFVLWGGKSPTEAISAALIETAGEA